MQLFSEKCPATLKDISLVRRSMRRALSEIRMSDELVDDLQLIVSEIAVNTIEHAAKSPTELEFRVRIRGAEIGIEIIDDGSPFENFDDKFGVFAPELQEVKGLNTALVASGRGIELVRDFADDIVYQPGPPNHFIAWRRLSKRQPTVLIVEDEQVLAEMYALGLYPTYRTIIVDTIEEALATLEHTTIDIVVADYHLTDGTGRILAETMETDPHRLPVPVIMITGDNNVSLKREMLEIGVEAALQKPVSKQELEDNIRLALRRAERRRTSHFRHFGAAAAKLLTLKIPEKVGGFSLGHHTNVADLGSGDAMLHLTSSDRDRVVLMDVMGHGLGAHSAAIALAAIARAIHSQRRDVAPNLFLRELSNALFADLTLGQLISTMLVLDLKDNGEVEVSSAGHPNPVVVRKDGIEQIDVTGPLLGFAPNVDYDCRKFSLKEGERLVSFTDGLDPMSLSAGEELPEWMSKALIESLPNPLERGMEDLLTKVRAAVGPEPDDDWTILALEQSA